MESTVVFYYHRHLRKGNDVLKIELVNTFIKTVPMETLDAVKEKYSHVPDADDAEEWHDELKLPQSILKRVKKDETAKLDEVAWDYLQTYLGVVENAKECEKSQKTQKVEKLAKGLAEYSGMAIVQFFLAYYDHNVALKLCKDVLFGIK